MKKVYHRPRIKNHSYIKLITKRFFLGPEILDRGSRRTQRITKDLRICIEEFVGIAQQKILTQARWYAILMPRHAMVVGNEIYIPSWRMHVIGKTELKFAKIVVR